MGIRETMNRYPALTMCVVVPVILAAIGFAVYMQLPEKPPKVQTRAFYTVDDGKTWFADSANKLCPFDKDGKEAVMAYVYQCGKEPPFVAYMQSLSPDAKKKIEELSKGGINQGNAPQIGMLQGTGIQRKRPGEDHKWLKVTDSDPDFDAMTNVSCKNGKMPEGVTPEIP